MPNIAHILSSLLEEAFPDTRYFWKGEEYDIFEVVDAKGLLPILVAQAKVNAEMLSPSLLAGWSVIDEEQSLTGRKVCASVSSEYVLEIPWILDAMFVAASRSQSPSEIHLDTLDPAITPTLSEILWGQTSPQMKERIVPE